MKINRNILKRRFGESSSGYGVPMDTKIDLVELIKEYSEELVNRERGDRTAGIAASKLYERLMDLISTL